MQYVLTGPFDKTMQYMQYVLTGPIVQFGVYHPAFVIVLSKDILIFIL